MVEEDIIYGVDLNLSNAKPYAHYPINIDNSSLPAAATTQTVYHSFLPDPKHNITNASGYTATETISGFTA